MKKILAFLLVVIVVMTIGVSVFAVNSPTSDGANNQHVAEKTSSLPSVVSKNSGAVLTEYVDYTKLNSDAQKIYKAAKKAVKDGAPDGMTAKYLFYFTADSYPTELVVEIKGANEICAKLYKNENWVELSTSANGGQYTITITDEGPVSIYTK